jgi:hypothetical protein
MCLVWTTSGSSQDQKPPSPPQIPATAPTPALAVPPEQREARGQPVNIRIDLSIVDEGGPSPSRKSVSLTIADRQLGSVRAVVITPGMPDVPLNVDATPMLEGEGRIRARISLDYRPNTPGGDSKAPVPPQMRVVFNVMLVDGKKIVAAQAADPTTDRRVSVEVTATILKS